MSKSYLEQCGEFRAALLGVRDACLDEVRPWLEPIVAWLAKRMERWS